MGTQSITQAFRSKGWRYHHELNVSLGCMLSPEHRKILHQKNQKINSDNCINPSIYRTFHSNVINMEITDRSYTIFLVLSL